MGEVEQGIIEVRTKLVRGDLGGAKRKLKALTKHGSVIKSKSSSIHKKLDSVIDALNTVKHDISNYEEHKDKPTESGFISEAVQNCNEAWGRLREAKQIANNM